MHNSENKFDEKKSVKIKKHINSDIFTRSNSKHIHFSSQKKSKKKKIHSSKKKLTKEKNEIAKKTVTCNCSKSNCQKNYCDCFKNGNYCSKDCRCIDCLNTRAIEKRNKPEKFSIEFVRVNVESTKLTVKEGKFFFNLDTNNSNHNNHNLFNINQGEIFRFEDSHKRNLFLKTKESLDLCNKMIENKKKEEKSKLIY